MRRREFLTWLGVASAAPVLLRASGANAALPVIGFLHSASPEPNAKRLSGFQRGLRSAGFVEGQNVAIEYRWAQGQNTRLPELAAELASKPVSVLATLSSTPATLAAKAATSTIPIVFLIAEDPVELGLVKSLSRPGSNVTGISSQNAELIQKRFQLLRELVPRAPAVAVLINQANPNAKSVQGVIASIADSLGVQLQILEASTDAEIASAYASLAPGVPLLITTDPSFFARRSSLIALSARHSVPTMFDNRESADAGGLIGYGQNTESSWEQAGGYVGRILKGAKPAELPVMRPTKFELVINLKTAREQGLDVPAALQARADDVVE
jgi:putative ABC transport system substrate-binding protein